ncbi:adenylate/guanylate cyclase domain-containing protein [Polyangium mundeleinium]|uniref:Adenylate/guanylate cyclase domain-containing protein n=1 Tax=Polyangium mundeleinium TaxID=2995306 RepID=A0ABT5EQR4_9BACT|nr:adenylate/guanylate cyclase domain-containing protein [Polyangium mundeleinium]MDC0743799.1 adenylate/guanylate cyclase domain-containing protein [Polyangium mundeleinium]
MAGAEKALVWLFGAGERQGGYPESFDAELAFQSWKILRVSGLICALAWLPYLRLDEALHPEIPSLFLLRLSLTMAGALAILFSLFPSAPRHASRALFALCLSLECATGLITGLTSGKSPYLGGFLFVLMLVPLAPLRRRYAWGMLGAAILVFWVTGKLAGMDFDGPERNYALQDLSAAVLVSGVFVHLSDRLRRQGWTKGSTIQHQSEEIARDKAKIDSLLCNILPAPIAGELAREGSVKPVFHEEATIVFADFVGFTAKAATMPPEALVATLDAYFCRFDAIADRSGVEKLKTIGDAYMAAAGLPAPTRTHAVDACLFALRIRRDVEGHDACFQGVRIGVHSGPVMAGMVGSKKFAYDVWGDTVNTASRMESSGELWRINVSRMTYDRVKDFFELTARGAVSVKGKGELDMYFLERILPALSRDEQGVEPNDVFWERYRALQSNVLVSGGDPRKDARRAR